MIWNPCYYKKLEFFDLGISFESVRSYWRHGYHLLAAAQFMSAAIGVLLVALVNIVHYPFSLLLELALEGLSDEEAERLIGREDER